MFHVKQLINKRTMYIKIHFIIQENNHVLYYILLIIFIQHIQYVNATVRTTYERRQHKVYIVYSFVN